MSLNFIFGNSQSVGLDLKSGFISDYGKYSSSYNNIDYFGNQKFNTLWPYLVLVVGIILSIITFIASNPTKDTKMGPPKERSSMQKLYLGLGWLFVLISVFGAGYGLYLYFTIYLPEYYKWFESLPVDAKGKLAMIESIDALISAEKRERTELARLSNR
jgi:hypothetical protein